MVEGNNSDENCSCHDDEECSNFYTPQHAPETQNGNTVSQDSIDIFHDAHSNLTNSLLKVGFLPKISLENCGDDAMRKRHFSSEARFDSANCNEVSETTSMLCPEEDVSRRRHASSGKPRIIPISPFRFNANSTHSLKQTNINRAIVHKPNCRKNKRECDNLSTSCTMSVPGLVNYVPYSETVQRESEKDKVIENNTLPPLSSVSTNSTTSPNKLQYDAAASNGNSSAWMRNYVACVEGGNFFSHNCLDSQGESSAETSNHQLRSSLLNPKIEKNLEYELGVYEKEKVYNDDQTCCGRFCRAFRLANCRFEHESPHLFVTSQWQKPDELSCLYVGYRLFWALYFLMWAVWSLVGFNGYLSSWNTKPFYFLFLTNWTIWLLAIDTCLQAINVIRHIRRISGKGHGGYLRMKRSFKISWILSTLMCTMQIFTAFLYWALIYPQRRDVEVVNEINVNTHIIPALYIVLDLFVAATPRRLLHVYLPMIYLTIYGAFTDIYYLSGGLDQRGSSKLYPILDWGVPFTTLMKGAGLILICVPIVHATVCCLACFREGIARRDTERPIKMNSYRMTEQYTTEAPV